MGEPTKIVVGLSEGEMLERDFDYINFLKEFNEKQRIKRNEQIHGKQARKRISLEPKDAEMFDKQRKHVEQVADACKKELNLETFFAGQDHINTTPDLVCGIKIGETYSEAIDLSDKEIQNKIQSAMERFEKKVGKKPKLWIIGH